MTYILSIPLLPNRLPLNSLTTLAPRIPLTALDTISIPRVLAQLDVLGLESRIHLLANLSVFTPPRYPVMSLRALAAYLQLTAEIMNSLPTHALEPPERNASTASGSWEDEDEDEDEPITRVEVVSSFAPPIVLPELDNKTRNRLQTLPSPAHVTSLLSASYKFQVVHMRVALFAWCQSLCMIWPGRKDKVVSAVVAWRGGGLVRELYRDFVRGSPLGQSHQISDAADLTSTSHKSLTMCQPH